MSETKIDIKIGQIQFSGQGNQEWIAEQLDKIIAQAEKLIQIAPPPTNNEKDTDNEKQMKPDDAIAGKTLPIFLKEKGAKIKQVKRFLATAVWLQAQGHKRLQTKDIIDTLKSYNQTALTNPADSLNGNVEKGFCEKDGNQFYVTKEGKASLDQ